MFGGSLVLASVVTFPTYSMYAEGYVFVTPDPNDNLLIETRRYLEDIAAELRTDARARGGLRQRTVRRTSAS